MQNFTGTGFTNDNIKKEDIVKQIKNKEDAIDNMHRLTVLANGYASKKLEAGMYGGFGSRAEDETDSKFDYNKFRQGKAQKALAEAEAEFDKFKKLNLEIIRYLREMPHD